MTGAIRKLHIVESEGALAEKIEPEREVNEGAIVEPIILNPRGTTWKRRGTGREYVLGLQRATIAAGATATIVVRPFGTYRPTRFILPRDIARFFDIIDIKVGNNSQFISPNAINGSLFADDAFPMELNFDIVMPAMDLAVTALNRSHAGLDFIGTFLGDLIP